MNERTDEVPFILPSGTVTLMLGDVEGSTRLWESAPEQMSAELARLSDIVGESVARHNGVRPLEQGEGDSFVAAFARPRDAIASAIDIQRGLTNSMIALRIGIHTGEVQLRGLRNYAGSTVNRAARLRDVGHGGQILVSASSYDLVRENQPKDTSFVDLGTHLLRDLTRPEQIYQLSHADLRDEFPPLRSLGTFRTNLPVQLTSFVGREAEIAQVRAMLGDARLLTLVGTGGCGKTRLALQVAAEMLDENPGGTWFIDLSEVSSGVDVGPAVAGVMGVREIPFGDPIDRVAEHIYDKRTLLILDNCEHVLEEAARAATRLLKGAEGARLLATSREPLKVPGEATVRVPSLQLPAPHEPAAIEAVAGCEAVQLFIERARRARHNFDLTENNVADVRGICERLDGIPLAIELAAAQVRALTPSRILAELDDRFRLLTGGARTLMPRQQTLRASVDWSHDLLSDEERILFRRLAIFSGGCTLDAAEDVCAGDDLDRYNILDLLIRLVDRSLVLMDDTGEEPRYRMLETVASYAYEELVASEERNATAKKHAEYFRSVAERWSGDDGAPPTGAAIAATALDYPDLIAALEYLRTQGDELAVANMVHALVPFWQMHGPSSAGRDCVAAALSWRERLPTELVPELIGDFIKLGVNPAENLALGEEAVRIARELGDKQLLAQSLHTLGSAKIWIDGGLAGLDVLEEALAAARESGPPPAIAQSLMGLATVEIWFGRFETARRRIDEAREIYRSLDEANGQARCVELLAQCEMLGGDLASSEELMREALRLTDPNNLAQRSALLWSLTGWVAGMGRYEEARQLAMEADALGMQLDPGSESYLGYFLARLAHRQGVATAKDLEQVLAQDSWDSILASIEVGDLVNAKKKLARMMKRVNQTRHPIALVTAGLAHARVALAEGDVRGAESHAHDSLTLIGDLKMWVHLPGALEIIATVAAKLESGTEAARLLGGAEATSKAMGIVRTPNLIPAHEELVNEVNALIGEEEFASAWKAGSELGLEELVAYARRGRGERKRPSQGWESLTPTELEVTRCIAAGMSNSEIAEKLFISTGTVRAHLSHIFGKLGVSSRTQLAVEATQRGATLSS